tara:strand:- start:271 stop:609 length:339 start_codon:yes stop_codon:yes gene_type:complete
MEQLYLTGNLGADPQMRYTDNGKAVVTFSLAVSQRKNPDGEVRPPNWYRCTAWENLAETINKYLFKGDKILVRGRVSADHYTNEESGEHYCNLGVNVRNIEFLNVKKLVEVE